MMRGLLLCGLVSAALAANAMGVSLNVIAPAGTDTISEGRSITPDGRYVVGASGSVISGVATLTGGVLWDATNATRAISGATLATGVGYRMNGQTQELVVNGTSTYSTKPVSTFWISNDGGSTWGQTLRNTAINKSVVLGNANTLGAKGTDDTFYGTYQSNQNYNCVHIVRGFGEPAAIGTTAVTGLGSLDAAQLRSVSGNGLAVGYKKVAGIRQNWMAEDPLVASSGTYFNGLAGTTVGEAFSISNDGKKIGGMSPLPAADGRTGNWPYVYDVDNDTILALQTLPDVGGYATNGVVYGLSADGSYAVGHNFRVSGGVGNESAVIWDVAANKVFDLTEQAAAAGVLGNFTRLGRAYSVGVNAAGNPVITGTGKYNDNGTEVTRGFVMEIPEPSSVLFVLLGGVALLRRR